MAGLIGSAPSAAQVGQANPDWADLMRPATLQLAAPPPLALYVHVPWCVRKCPYCDFNSHAWDQAVQGAVPEQQWVLAILADLEAALPLVWGRKVHSIFFGGGTPSLLAPQTVAALLAAIRARVDLVAGAEITLEANPGSYERDRFAAFAQAGVTRLSIGVQSFDDQALRAIGRVHDAAQAHAAVQEARRCFSTFNVDLMYALPGQTLTQWERTLQQALTHQPPHLSIYHLSLEPNTYFAKHPPALPDDDSAYEMLDAAVMATSAAGLSRYEVSAFARKGHRCRHNLNYWAFGDYLGVGPGAHSKLTFAHRILRQVRLRDPQRYMAQALKGLAVSSNTEVARGDLPLEFMLNALRLVEGFDMRDFVDRTGLPASSIARTLDRAVARGLLVQQDQRYRPSAGGLDFLSDLQAMFIADD